MFKKNIMKYFRPLPVLASERLLLRHARIEDTDDLSICMKNPDISRFEVWEPHRTNIDTLSYVNSLIFKYENNTGTEWIIERVRDGRAIGMINLHDIAARNLRAEMGFWLAEDCWHNGYAAEAADTVLDFAFNTAGFHKIVCKCVSENLQSEKLIRRLGFTFDGTMRGDMLIKGEFRDIDIYSMLKEEYR